MFRKLFRRKEEEPIPNVERDKIEEKEDKKDKEIKTRVKKDFALLRAVGGVKKEGMLQPLIKLGSIILKNYKLMVRSKLSSLIFFFGPLLIIFLVCLAFNTSSLYGVNIAAYSDSYSTLTNSLVDNISSKNYFILKTETKEKCIDAVKFGDYQACIIFPSKMVVDNSARNTIEIHVDSSRVNIANHLTELLTSKVSVQANEITTDMVSKMVNVIDSVKSSAVTSQPIMNKLAINNDFASNKIGFVVSQFSGFDFTYSSFDTTAISTEISNIKSLYNMSTSAFSTLESIVSNTGTDYNKVTTKMDEAKSYADSLKADTTNLKGYIDNNKPYINKVNSSLASMVSETDKVKIKKVTSIVTPFKTKISSINKSRNYLIYLLPPLFVLLIMFVSIFMSSSSIIREKTSSAYFRNFITPTHDGLFMLGQYITDISIIFVQIAIMLGVMAYFVSGISLMTYIGIGIVLLVLATVFILIGIILGFLFNTNESVTIASISVGSILLFFSNSILPLETLSGIVRKVVIFNPFVIGEKILRRMILFDLSPFSAKNFILMLIVFVIYFLILAVVAREITKRLSHLSYK